MSLFDMYGTLRFFVRFCRLCGCIDLQSHQFKRRGLAKGSACLDVAILTNFAEGFEISRNLNYPFSSQVNYL